MEPSGLASIPEEAELPAPRVDVVPDVTMEQFVIRLGYFLREETVAGSSTEVPTVQVGTDAAALILERIKKKKEEINK